MNNTREILVSREWLEQLEDYLEAVERFSDPTLFKNGKPNIVLYTPTSRKIIFVKSK